MTCPDAAIATAEATLGRPDVCRTRDLVVKFARSPEEIDQAFRLRHRVFIEEAGIAPSPAAAGRERDLYDALCDHLVVKDVRRNLVVGNYRMLPGARLKDSGFYTESQFDLSGFRHCIPDTLELGRSCIHPDYRETISMQLLWNAMMGHFLAGFRYLIGCVSVPVSGLRELNELFTCFANEGLVTDRFGISPRASLRLDGVRRLGNGDGNPVKSRLPPLVKAYIRIGGEVAAEPVFDPIFKTYDFCMVLERDRVPARYRRRAAPPAV